MPVLTKLYLLVLVGTLCQAQKPLVRKCACESTEIYTEGIGCTGDPRLEELVANSPFDYFVKELECPRSLKEVRIEQGNFLLQLDGSMFINFLDIEFTDSSYCSENILNEKNEIVPFVNICLSEMNLPRCCSSSQKASYGSTNESSVDCAESTEVSEKIDADISVGGSMTKWNGLKFMEHNLYCPTDEDLLVTDISDDVTEAHLNYGASGIELKWKNDFKLPVSFESGSFCLDGTDSTNLEAYFCYKDAYKIHQMECSGQSCVRKCCPAGEIFGGEKCVKSSVADDWRPMVYNEVTKATEKLNASSNHFKFVHGFPLCESYYFYDDDKSSTVLPSGDLLLPKYRFSYASTDYCLDDMKSEDGTITDMVLICFRDEDQTENPCTWNKIIQLVALSISCVFIVITLFVYLSVGELLKLILSKCVVSESFAVLVSFICLITLKLIDRTVETKHICMPIGKIETFNSSMC